MAFDPIGGKEWIVTNPRSPMQLKAAVPESKASSTRAVGVGASVLADARAAGREAAAIAVGQEEPKLVIVLASSLIDLDEMLSGVVGVTGDAELIGCTTAGEIASSGAGESGVVVVVFSGEGFSIATGIGTVTAGDLRGAAAEAAGCAEAVQDRGNTILLLLSDGLAGDQQEVVRGAYQQVGAGIPLVGGCAGDDVKMLQTNQFHGDRVVQHSIVAAAISSDAPIGIGVRHGWKPVGEPMVVTEADGVIVERLDDRPALDTYLDRLDAPPEVRCDPAAFTEFAATRPIGLSRRGREEIRFVATADFERRAIHCFAEVPQGSVGWIMSGDAGSILEATDEACRESLIPLDGAAPAGVLVFDCIARKGVLGTPGLIEEVERISSHGGDAPIAGFYTYGEIARVEGATGFHNQTLVVLAVG